ncbi:MAG TPA: hypothetical protein VGC95_05200 [Chitinophagaceae bacterium]
MRALLVFISLTIVACNNSSEDHSKQGKTRADSLMDDVVQGHNVGMSRMDKVAQLQKHLRQRIDSIQLLGAPQRQRLSTYSVQLDTALAKLKTVNDAMETWMNEFVMDSSINNQEERVKYLENEKRRINRIKDSMLSGIQRADTLLRQ